MKIGKQFNRLTYREDLEIIDRREKYTDFDILGLYRSLLENEKLSLEEKLAIRDRAHRDFEKTFEFLQLKDPLVYIRFNSDRSRWAQKLKVDRRNAAKRKLRDRGYD